MEVSAFFTYTIGASDRKEDMDLTFGELSLNLFPTPGTDHDPDRGKIRQTNTIPPCTHHFANYKPRQVLQKLMDGIIPELAFPPRDANVSPTILLICPANERGNRDRPFVVSL